MGKEQDADKEMGFFDMAFLFEIARHIMHNSLSVPVLNSRELLQHRD